MGERILLMGNEAIAVGAIHAGCKAFFGYPITPQNEIPEYMSRELPKNGGVFVQSESEVASINMVMGGSLAGVRVMTSTSSLGFSLMQETIARMAICDLPAVVVNVTRMTPGSQTAQTDYRQATKGGGHGGYRCIVLAPYSAQEHLELVQLAFHLSDKYRMIVILLSDAMLGQMVEPVKLETMEFGPLPSKEWALRGKKHHGGKRNEEGYGIESGEGGLAGFYQRQVEKYERISLTEVRYTTYRTEDVDLLLVAFGSMARMAQEAVDMARGEGIKVGLLRPITLWPFPTEVVRKVAVEAGRVLVVEDSQGQLVEDVKAAVESQVPVHLLGLWARHLRSTSGIIYPEAILKKVRELT